MRTIAIMMVLLLILLANTVNGEEVKYFFITQNGVLPIILTAPHGGTENPCGLQARSGGLRGIDKDSDLMTLEVAKALTEKTGKAPYLLINKIHRNYIDFNRRAKPASRSSTDKAEIAFDDENGRVYWEFWHARLREYRKEIADKFPGKEALIIDLHVHSLTSVDAGIVSIGNCKRKTIGNLIDKYGEVVVTGENSLFMLLKTKGYRVADNHPQAGYCGYTIYTHSSKGTSGFLIELPAGITTVEKERVEFARSLADALLTFLDAYNR